MPKGRTGSARPPLVLDTHVWLWAMEGTKAELSSGTVVAIEEAGGRGDLVVSAISVWEIAMLEARGRISMSRSVDEWLAAALSAPGVRLAELTPEIAVESTRLPGDPHGDPADRMIIATARVLGGTVVTRDDAILRYGAKGHVRARDTRS